ncbi:putative MFS-type transporter YitG [Paenibacillus baekrokdamisoli]|uniref:Putative MFS-type transporter YitG n=1 Tax=Paenibacillus baekrokdamisoli TaxID=1712516 RepID=A0A3G9ILX0_9BACL|nr:ACDE family multidrug resistance protein [Paenibacillus baekrokdamisoli]BBH19326.1 putative MFS-type transporter YitG [Paenibacillus baekrokdamisoli]
MDKVKSRWTADKSSKMQVFTSENKNHAAGKKQNKPDSSSQGKWKAYIALASVPMVLVLGNSMLVPILPDMEKELHISSFQASLVITLFSLAAAIAIPFAGFLSDRFSRKAIILPSLAIYGIAGIAAGIAAVMHSYGFLIAARALQGIGAAGTAPIAMALVGDKYKDGTESEALGLIEASNGAGKVISPILGSLLALIAWYAPLFAFPLFCAAAFAAMLLMIKEPPNEKKATSAKVYLSDIKKIFHEKGKWLLAAFIAGSLGLFILFGVLFRLSDLLEKAPYHIDGVAKGGVLAIPLLGLVATSYLTGKKIKSNGSLMRKLMITGLGLMSGSLAMAAWLHSNIYALIGFALLSSIGTGLLLPCLNTLITGSVDRPHRGMVTSLYSSLRFFGVAIGPPLFGYIAKRSDTLLFGIVAGLAAAACVLIIVCVRPPAKVNKQV